MGCYAQLARTQIRKWKYVQGLVRACFCGIVSGNVRVCVLMQDYRPTCSVTLVNTQTDRQAALTSCTSGLAENH